VAFALLNPKMRDRISAVIDELFGEMHPGEKRTLAG